MTEHEFEYWQAVMERSAHHWMEDDVTRLNGKGELYYTGGESGMYMRLYPDGKLSVGRYEDAFPHIGEALFKCAAEHQFESFDEASIAACKLGGQKFLVDLFSDGGVRETLVEPQEQNFGSFEMKM